jgi:hypothetical protein
MNQSRYSKVKQGSKKEMEKSWKMMKYWKKEESGGEGGYGLVRRRVRDVTNEREEDQEQSQSNESG